VDVVHDVGADGGGHHGRQVGLSNDGTRVGSIKDRDKRTRHFSLLNIPKILISNRIENYSIREKNVW
jgi:hypothetical protein